MLCGSITSFSTCATTVLFPEHRPNTACEHETNSRKTELEAIAAQQNTVIKDIIDVTRIGPRLPPCIADDVRVGCVFYAAVGPVPEVT